MEDKKVGLIGVGLDGERMDKAEEFIEKARVQLENLGLEIVNKREPIASEGSEVEKQVRICENNGAACIIYLIGTWILADHIVDAVNGSLLPIGIWGIPEPVSFSSVGANVMHGTLTELNIAHELFYGIPDDETVGGEIRDFVKACGVLRSLRKAKLGIIGGKTISAYPTTADDNQIKEKFGTEIIHMDQLIVLEKAREMKEGEVEGELKKVKKMYGHVKADDKNIRKSIRIYLALKSIIEENRLDGCSIKCIGEFMDYYNSCCLALSMLNDEGYLLQCQCNVNALLSAYILSQLSTDPVYFGDISTVGLKDQVVRVINCGSIPGKLAAGYQDIHLVNQYEYMGKGGGVCTLFCCKPGIVTFGTLGRVHGKYVMNIAKGEAFTQLVETLKEVRNWAQGFIKLEGNPAIFYRNILSNHSVFAYGDFKKELEYFCKLTSVEIMSNMQG